LGENQKFIKIFIKNIKRQLKDLPLYNYSNLNNAQLHPRSLRADAVDLYRIVKLESSVRQKLVFDLRRVYADLERHKRRGINADVTLSRLKYQKNKSQPQKLRLVFYVNYQNAPPNKAYCA